MNSDKLKKLQSQVRIGGKGTPRRKKKVVHATAATDDKKLESSLKKLALNPIPGIEEVNMIKDDGTVVHFNNPKAKASLAANTFVITGHGETRQVADMLPGILAQLGPEGIGQLKRLASAAAASSSSSAPRHAAAPRRAGGAAADYDEVPQLAGDFDEAAKKEAQAHAAATTPVAAAATTPATPVAAATTPATPTAATPAAPAAAAPEVAASE